MTNLNILIPMAGLGSRFSEQGYLLPKPLVDVCGTTMIEAVVKSLGLSGRYIFIVQKHHNNKYEIERLLKGMVESCEVIEVDGITEGAAVTALLAKGSIDNSTPLVIANADQIVSWDSEAFVSKLGSNNMIATFRAKGPKWSYAKIKDGIIVEVAEKVEISNDATVGIYGWTKGADFVRYAEQMISKGIRSNGEFYIAPVYNQSIAELDKVLPFPVLSMHGIGTPEDLEEYLENNCTQG